MKADYRILYMGDSTLDTAASYLAAVMGHSGLQFDYVPSGASADDLVTGNHYALYILSDYPAEQLSAESMQTVAAAVQGGSGLLMIGGWESFCGSGGFYGNTPIAALLPVEIMNEDDRVNWWGPCVVIETSDHETLAGLSFDSLPLVAGYNRLIAREGATTVLSVIRFRVREERDENGNLAVRSVTAAESAQTTVDVGGESRSVAFSPLAVDPLLVVGQSGAGRVAAFASDFAPHWVGGLVDWGIPRLTAGVPGSSRGATVEVGSLYASLVGNLVRWCGRLT